MRRRAPALLSRIESMPAHLTREGGAGNLDHVALTDVDAEPQRRLQPLRSLFRRLGPCALALDLGPRSVQLLRHVVQLLPI
jgi:hypothetical protein